MLSMEVDDRVDMTEHLVSHGEASIRRRNTFLRRATLCLGVLCVALLAGNVAQLIHSVRPTSDSSPQAGGRGEELKATSHKPEAVEGNLTEHKNRLCGGVQMEEDQTQLDPWNARKHDEASRGKLDGPKSRCENETANEERVRASNMASQKEKEQLRSLLTSVATSRDGLQRDYDTLKRDQNRLLGNLSAMMMDKERLEGNYSALRLRENLLQISYDELREEKSRVESGLDALKTEHERLRANYSRLTADRNRLLKKVDKMADKTRDMSCENGWRKFDISCYFVSKTKKNWTESRRDCLSRRADLVVINSWEEQAFVNGMLRFNSNAWIGLTDLLEEGAWMWVDQTPVTIEFWQPGQPNNSYKDQDCGETVEDSSGGPGQWNDDGCFAVQFWVCEK